MDDREYLRIVGEILFDSGLIGRGQKENFTSRFDFEKIHADGSLRNFTRVKSGRTSLCVAVYPSAAIQEGLAEARSAKHIAGHLSKKGVPVPAVLGADDATGLVVFEDCGDVRLFDLLPERGRTEYFVNDEIITIYKDVINILVHMQIKGAENFKPEWCYDTPAYNREIMIKRESEYFLNSFWYDLLQGDNCIDIKEEFEEIAAQAGTGLNTYFLHRDFQCRNIMLTDGRVRIIDFQAGRLGPPGYDLASLLIDPYSCLPEGFREELLTVYLQELGKCINFDEKQFCQQYRYLVLQRNMQILGAFSFLYTKRKKTFFKDFIVPSLHLLGGILAEAEMRPYTKLRSIVERAERCIKNTI